MFNPKSLKNMKNFMMICLGFLLLAVVPTARGVPVNGSFFNESVDEDFINFKLVVHPVNQSFSIHCLL
jgi:hypothetical protein